VEEVLHGLRTSNTLLVQTIEALEAAQWSPNAVDLESGLSDIVRRARRVQLDIQALIKRLERQTR